MFGTRGAWYGQLLLFAALLFGIFTMHTVGHPAEHGGNGAAPTASRPPAMHDPTAVHDPLAVHDVTAADAVTSSRSMAPAVLPVEATHPDAHRPARPAPMQGMDPMAVCLAVLSAWGLALLTALLVAGLPAGSVPGSTAARSPRMPRPPPPPRPPKAVLTGLSVLRI